MMTKKQIKTIATDMKKLERGKKIVDDLYKSFKVRQDNEYLDSGFVRVGLLETLQSINHLLDEYETYIITDMSEEEKALLKK